MYGGKGDEVGRVDHFRRSPEEFPHPLSSQEMGTTGAVLEINRCTTAHSNCSWVWTRSGAAMRAEQKRRVGDSPVGGCTTCSPVLVDVPRGDRFTAIVFVPILLYHN